MAAAPQLGCWNGWQGNAYRPGPFPGGNPGGQMNPQALIAMLAAMGMQPQQPPPANQQALMLQQLQANPQVVQMLGGVAPAQLAQLFQMLSPSACPFPMKRWGKRNGVVGFTTASLPVGASILNVTINKPFAGHILQIPSDFAADITIVEIFVAGNNQLIQGPLPGRCYSEAVQCCADLDLDGSQSGTQIGLSLINNRAQAIPNFGAQLQGERLDC